MLRFTRHSNNPTVQARMMTIQMIQAQEMVAGGVCCELTTYNQCYYCVYNENVYLPSSGSSQ